MFEEQAKRIAERLRQETGKTELPPLHPQLLPEVIRVRLEALRPERPAKEPPRPDRVSQELQDFVVERLSRCGLEIIPLETHGILEIWDILDDFEYHLIVGI